MAISHWQSQWPLTQGWRYRAACDYLHFASHRLPLKRLISLYLQTRCSSWCPSNSFEALESRGCSFYPRGASYARVLAVIMCLYVSAHFLLTPPSLHIIYIRTHLPIPFLSLLDHYAVSALRSRSRLDLCPQQRKKKKMMTVSLSGVVCHLGVRIYYA